MKFSTIQLISIGTAADVTVSPIEKLDQLTGIAAELFGTLKTKPGFGKPDRWVKNWNEKFLNNAGRMKRSYQKCGTKYDQEDSDFVLNFDRENPCNGISDLMRGVWNWVNQYLSTCRLNSIVLNPVDIHDHHGHQHRRVMRWSNIFYKGKG